MGGANSLRLGINPPAGGGSTYVNSIQRGSITIASGSASNTATISAVGSGAVLLYDSFTSNRTATAIGTDYPRLELTNSTTITAKRGGSPSQATTVYYTIIDFKAAMVSSVQYGTINVNVATSNTASISSVNTSRSAVFYLGFESASTGTGNNAYVGGVKLTNSTTVTADVSVITTTTDIFGFVVVEFNSSVIQSVQQFQTGGAWGASATMDQTISAVTVANTMIAWGGSTLATSNTSNGIARAELTSTTNVRLTRGGTGSITATIYYTVIEFVSGVLYASVQRGSITITGTSNTASVTTNSFSIVNYVGHSTTGASNAGSSWAWLTLTSSVLVTAGRYNSTSGNCVPSYEVIAFN